MVKLLTKNVNMKDIRYEASIIIGCWSAYWSYKLHDALHECAIEQWTQIIPNPDLTNEFQEFSLAAAAAEVLC